MFFLTYRVVFLACAKGILPQLAQAWSAHRRASHHALAVNALGLTLVMMTCCSLPNMAVADNTTRQQQLNTIRAQISAIDKLLAKQLRDENNVAQQLRTLEISLAEIRQSLIQQDQKIAAKTAELRQLQTRSVQLQKDLAGQQALLKEQLRSAYLMGNQGQLQLLLNQHDASVVSRLMTYYEYLNGARTRRISEAEMIISDLEQVRLAIVQEQQQLKTLRAKKNADLNTLGERFNERRDYIAALRDNIQSSNAELIDLQQNKRRITTLINSLETVINDIPIAPPEDIVFSENRGRLPWPLSGNVRNRFGKLRAGQDIVWQGYFLDSPIGSEVKAIASGRVVFADWLAGFGLLIIIDHQDNYMSLYAHNSVLFTEVGSWINANAVIAESGQTGGIENAGLYFEIRKNGQPIDPKNWLAKR